jgi:urease accessory protein
VTGHLDLVCAADDAGVSYLREQSFCAPMHISKPFHDEGALVMNVVNPTAGLFAGDEIRCEVRVERGARLVLTSPSANRAHQMREGEARMEQKFSIARGAWLEVFTAPLIPQAGSRFRQTTRIDVESGGSLLFFEVVYPGRVASGESLAFEWLRWSTDIFVGGNLVARENYTQTPASLAALQRQFAHPYYASCFVIGENIDEACWCAIAEMHNDSTWVGCSAVSSDGWVIKVLAGDSPSLRAAVHKIRARIYAASGSREPLLRHL